MTPEQLRLPLSSNFPAAEGMDIDGRQLSKNIFAIGKVVWNATAGRWQCLANVEGMLCLVEVKIRRE